MNKRKAWSWESNLEGTLTGFFVLIVAIGLISGWIIGGILMSILFGLIASEIGILIVGLNMVIIHMADNVREMKDLMTKMDSSVITPTSTALSKAAAEKKQQEDVVATLKNGGWKCDNCGRTNPSYTGTCACGNSKP